MALFLPVQEEDDLYQRSEEKPQCLEEDILMRVIVTLMTIDHVRDRRYPGRRRHYQDRGGRPPDREDNQDRGYPRRGRLPR